MHLTICYAGNENAQNLKGSSRYLIKCTISDETSLPNASARDRIHGMQTKAFVIIQINLIRFSVIAFVIMVNHVCN